MVILFIYLFIYKNAQILLISIDGSRDLRPWWRSLSDNSRRKDKARDVAMGVARGVPASLSTVFVF